VKKTVAFLSKKQKHIKITTCFVQVEYIKKTKARYSFVFVESLLTNPLIYGKKYDI
jgi:hypothetical protein